MRPGDDKEAIKAGVNCATVLEKLSAGWELDPKGSTRRSPKYRRANGDVIIVNHDGRGWYDPKSRAKGDVFTLVRHLDLAIEFPDAIRVLGSYVGVAPSLPVAENRRQAEERPPVDVEQRWQRQEPLRPGSPVWRYLTDARALPAEVLRAPASVGGIREGGYGSAWFAHRDQNGRLTGFEMRGPNYRGFSSGGGKTLFRWLAPRSGTSGILPRLAVLEASIDALSMAAIEGMRTDTLYVSTTGGMGPATVAALETLLQAMTSAPGAVLIAATDADEPGCRYAGYLADIARDKTVAFERLLPPDGHNDWNDVLRARAGLT